MMFTNNAHKLFEFLGLAIVCENMIIANARMSILGKRNSSTMDPDKALQLIQVIQTS